MTDGRHDSNQTSGDAADLVEARVIAPLRRARLEPDDLQLARFSAALDTALQDAVVAQARAHGDGGGAARRPVGARSGSRSRPPRPPR